MADGPFQYRANQLAPAQAFGQVGDTFNNINVRIAQMMWEKALREQQLGMQQQGLGIRREELGIRQKQLEANQARDAGTAEYNKARAEGERAKVQNATRFGAAIRGRVNTDRGPTLVAGRALNEADIWDQYAQSQALAGKASELMNPQSIAAGSVGYIPYSRERIQGNINLSPGHTLIEEGQAPYTAPENIKLAPGEVAFQTGSPYLTGASPVPPPHQNNQMMTPGVAGPLYGSMVTAQSVDDRYTNSLMPRLQGFIESSIPGGTNAPPAGAQQYQQPYAGQSMLPPAPQPAPPVPQQQTLVQPPEVKGPDIRATVFPQRQGGESVVPGLQYGLPKMDYRTPQGAAQLKHEALNAVLVEKRDPKSVRQMYEEQTGLPADFLPPTP